MKLIEKIPDAVEKKHYMKSVAEKLEVDLEDLENKEAGKKEKKIRLKPIKTEKKKITTDEAKKLKDSLEAILVYGGAAGGEIKLDFPEDETRISELELIFEKEFSKMKPDELEKEARFLMKRYEDDIIQSEIDDLTKELETVEDDDEKTAKILRKIQNLRNRLN